MSLFQAEQAQLSQPPLIHHAVWPPGQFGGPALGLLRYAHAFQYGRAQNQT